MTPPTAGVASGGRSKRSEDRRLLERYKRDGDPGAREELVRRFLPLACRLAQRYERANEPLDDLVQVASVGLLKAIDRFDPGREAAFSSFAVPTILGELKRHFRDAGWAVRVPRGVQERVLDIRRAMEQLSSSLGRSPTPAELGKAIGASAEEVLEAMEATSAYEAASLDAPRASDAGDGDVLADRFGEDDGGYELVDDRQSIVDGFMSLPERQRLVLRLRFEDDMTQAQIAQRLGISQMHVSRLIRGALAQIRDVAATKPQAA